MPDDQEVRVSPEQMKVLEMLAAGKISAAEAERLLERLAAGPADGAEAGGPEPRAADPAAGIRATPADRSAEPEVQGGVRTGRGLPKFLRIVVDSARGDKVNVRVPIELLRTGLALGSMLPNSARERLDAKGIDFSRLASMDGDRLVEVLRELTVDVDAADGETVRIYCE